MKLSKEQEASLKSMTPAERRGYDALPNDTHRLQALNTRLAKQAAQPKAEKPAKEPKVDAKANMKITVKAEKNPKRPASASHARFELYKPGMTVAAYVAACKAANLNPRAARADIDWDSKHGFITLA